MFPVPFLKWAGGKSQLLQQFEPLFPSDFRQYIEPFVGGGAVFFYLYSQNKIKKGILLDCNLELIDCYIAIRNNLPQLIRALKTHKRRYQRLQEKYYYQVRNEIRNDLKRWNRLSIVNRAAVTIFLNKTCFNGLYRVNSKNQFNAPIGKYHNPAIYDLKNLRAVSQSLGLAGIKNVRDFSECLKYANKGDFIYLDPPYNPLSKTANFTGYTKYGFGEKEQIRLFKVFKILDKRGCKVMLSNSDTDFIRRLYKGYRTEIVKASRAINCNSAGRGKINELVVLNYQGGNMSKLPKMSFRKDGIEHIPVKMFQVNDNTIIAVYKGSLSPLDILIKYRQKLKNGEWSNIRTPKHIHWTVDILMKMQAYKELTQDFLNFFIDIWEKTTPMKSEQERQSIDLEALLNMSKSQIEKFKDLSKKGEYSVKFLILLAKLLMLQEKTNRPDAYMFKRVLEGLKEGEDLFHILSTATLGRR